MSRFRVVEAFVSTSFFSAGVVEQQRAAVLDARVEEHTARVERAAPWLLSSLLNSPGFFAVAEKRPAEEF